MLRSRKVEKAEPAETTASQAEEPLVITLLRNTGIAAYNRQNGITVPVPSEEELAETRRLADHSGAEVVNLAQLGVDRDAAATLPAAIARRHLAAVVGRRFGLPLVAVATPNDATAMSEIAAAIGDALLVIAPRSQLEACVEVLYPAEEGAPDAVAETEAEAETASAEVPEGPEGPEAPPAVDVATSEPFAAEADRVADEVPPHADGAAPSGGEVLQPSGEAMPATGEDLLPIGEALQPTSEVLPPTDAAPPIADAAESSGVETLPFADEAVPSPAEAVPFADEAVPPSGEVLQPVGEASPFATEVQEFAGEAMPPTGETPFADVALPMVEEVQEFASEAMPPTGEVLPPVGEVLRPGGEVSPFAGETAAPAMGPAWPEHDHANTPAAPAQDAAPAASPATAVGAAGRYGVEDIDWYRLGSMEFGAMNAEAYQAVQSGGSSGPAAPQAADATWVPETAEAEQRVRHVTDGATTPGPYGQPVAVAPGGATPWQAAQVPPVALRQDDAAGVEESAAARLVELVLGHAVEDGTTEVHVDPGLYELSIRRRVDGVLQPLTGAPAGLTEAVSSRLKRLAGLDPAARGLPQSGRLSLGTGARVTDVSITTLPTAYGEKLVVHVDRAPGTPVGLEDLGFLPDVLERYRRACRRSWGTVLVAGSDEKGASATLHATVAELNSPARNIVVVGDGIGEGLAGVNRIRLQPAEGFGQAEALDAAVRADADVIVSEIRDRRTASGLLGAALDGHLVLGRARGARAAELPQHLVDMGVEPFAVAHALSGVVVQRFVRSLCRRCAQPYQPPLEQLHAAGWDEHVLAEGEHAMFLRPSGCEACLGTGYSGRIALQEMLVVTEGVGRALVAGASVEALGRLAVEEGMTTLHRDGLRKAALGMTTLAEAFRAFL